MLRTGLRCGIIAGDPMPKLVVERGPDRGKSVEVTPSMPVTVGRDPACPLPLSDTMVSRHHFRILFGEEGYEIVDLDSFNGTLVNGSPSRSTKIEPGDVIKVGVTVLSFSPDNAAADPLIDQTLFSKYQIIERVGRGGMGTCYKARQLDLDRIVAVKVIAAAHSENRDFIDQFIKEARYSAKLNHPNVVQVYEVGQDAGRTFYAMELLPGGTVADRLAREPEQRLDPAEAVEIALQVARALQYAHRKGIMHRDLKPENLLIGEGRAVKLADLGLAQSLGERTVVGERNYVLGTPHFIAPEIVRNEPFDFRSDIYSLGVCLYQTLTGKMPYEAETLKELVRKKCNTEGVPADKHVPSLPRSLTALVARMIRRRPEDRPATVDEVIVELERISKQLAGPAIPIRVLLPVTAGALVLLIVLIVVVALSARRPPEIVFPPPPPPPRDETARKVFAAAEAFEFTQMDANSLDSMREATRRYEEIVADFADTPFAARAAARRDAVLRRLAELEATSLLRAAQSSENDAYPVFSASMAEGRPNPTVFKEVIAGYRRLAADPRLEETEAAAIASARARLIEGWISAILALKGWHEATVEAAAGLIAMGRYDEALRAWEDLLQRVDDAAGPYRKNPDPRYRVIFYDSVAQEGRRGTAQQVAEAAASFLKQVDRLLELNDFDGALETLDRGEPRFAIVDEARSLFGSKRAEARTRRRAFEEEERRRLAELQRRLLEADADQFARLCGDIYEGYSSRCDFASAVDKVIDRRRDAFKTEAFLPRLEDKRGLLRRADAFLKAFFLVVNDERNAAAVNRKFDLPGFATRGRLAAAAADGLEIETSPGTRQKVRYELLSGWQLHTLVRKAWEIKDLATLVNFVAFLIEVGASSEARAELATLAGHPGFPGNLEAEEFHRRCADAVSLKSPIDPPEIEAQKRLRAARSMMDAAEFARALGVLQELAGPLKETPTGRARKEEIDTMLATARKKIEERKKDK
jgi:serine/threonine protein kinase